MPFGESASQGRQNYSFRFRAPAELFTAHISSALSLCSFPFSLLGTRKLLAEIHLNAGDVVGGRAKNKVRLYLALYLVLIAAYLSFSLLSRS
jgi:hypothetical protein